MIKYLLVFFVFISFTPTTTSQTSLNDYSFVVVPEQFSFLDTPDEYQLNSLTKFLFNKYGFHAFFGNELPTVSRCDGLWAEVDGNSGIIYTKITILLKDCNGLEVYRTAVGRSKLKAYNKTYQDALRKAFRSIIGLGVQQKEMVVFDGESEPMPMKAEETVAPSKPKTIETVKETPAEVTTEAPSVAISTVTRLGSPPQSKFSTYVHRGQSYLLKRTAEGYALYEESSQSDNGLLLLGTIAIDTASNVQFIDVLGKASKARFDQAGDLVIEKNGAPMYYKYIRN